MGSVSETGVLECQKFHWSGTSVNGTIFHYYGNVSNTIRVLSTAPPHFLNLVPSLLVVTSTQDLLPTGKRLVGLRLCPPLFPSRPCRYLGQSLHPGHSRRLHKSSVPWSLSSFDSTLKPESNIFGYLSTIWLFVVTRITRDLLWSCGRHTSWSPK